MPLVELQRRIGRFNINDSGHFAAHRERGGNGGQTRAIGVFEPHRHAFLRDPLENIRVRFPVVRRRSRNEDTAALSGNQFQKQGSQMVAQDFRRPAFHAPPAVLGKNAAWY